MTAKNSDTPLYLAKINGKQVYELVGNYLADFDSDFYVTNKYELPIASGMKIIVKDKENGFSLKGIAVNEKKIDKEKEYSILLTDITMSILKKLYPECEITQLKDTTLSSAWAAAMSKGQQPSAPEDYIEVENKSAIRQKVIKRKRIIIPMLIILHHFSSILFMKLLLTG